MTVVGWTGGSYTDDSGSAVTDSATVDWTGNSVDRSKLSAVTDSATVDWTGNSRGLILKVVC